MSNAALDYNSGLGYFSCGRCSALPCLCLHILGVELSSMDKITRGFAQPERLCIGRILRLIFARSLWMVLVLVYNSRAFVCMQGRENTGHGIDRLAMTRPYGCFKLQSRKPLHAHSLNSWVSTRVSKWLPTRRFAGCETRCFGIIMH